MDWDKLELPLQVRSRREGDVFHPLGSTGSKKLKDFLIDEKVPKKERGYVPVLQDAKGIIWVAGFRMADRVKVTGSTRKVLHLHISRNRE